jgi:hypothetical protein
MNVDQLSETLRGRAGGDVDPAPIVARARSRGRWVKVRRRVTAGAVAVLCAVLVAVVATVPRKPPPHGPEGSDASPAPAPTLSLPVAPGVAGALEAPATVGTFHGQVHFAADELATGADLATWAVGPGIESVDFIGRARVVLARTVEAIEGAPLSLPVAGSPTTPASAQVGDRPATAWSDLRPDGMGRLWSVRWQPGDGLWAQLDMYAADEGEALTAAAGVTFDETRRCVVPFKIHELPGSTGILGCTVTFGRQQGFAEGALIMGDGGNRWLTLRAERMPEGDLPDGTLPAGPYRAARVADGVLEIKVRPCLVDLFLADRGRGYTEQDGLLILGGYLPAQDLDRPDSW